MIDKVLVAEIQVPASGLPVVLVAVGLHWGPVV